MKTAGTSMEIALSRSCGPSDILTPFGAPEDEEYRKTLVEYGYQDSCNYEKYGLEEHLEVSTIVDRIPQSWWNSYTKIAVIRDPIDYTISRYYWDCRHKLKDGTAPKIDDWVRRDPKKIGHNWRIHSINNRPSMDFYMLYDRLANDCKILSRKLNLDYDLAEEVAATTRKTKWRKKKDPIQKEDTRNFILSKSSRESKLIDRVRKERT